MYNWVESEGSLCIMIVTRTERVPKSGGTILDMHPTEEDQNLKKEETFSSENWQPQCRNTDLPYVTDERRSCGVNGLVFHL